MDVVTTIGGVFSFVAMVPEAIPEKLEPMLKAYHRDHWTRPLTII